MAYALLFHFREGAVVDVIEREEAPGMYIGGGLLVLILIIILLIILF